MLSVGVVKGVLASGGRRGRSGRLGDYLVAFRNLGSLVLGLDALLLARVLAAEEDHGAAANNKDDHQENGHDKTVGCGHVLADHANWDSLGIRHADVFGVTDLSDYSGRHTGSACLCTIDDVCAGASREGRVRAALNGSGRGLASDQGRRVGDVCSIVSNLTQLPLNSTFVAIGHGSIVVSVYLQGMLSIPLMRSSAPSKPFSHCLRAEPASMAESSAEQPALTKQSATTLTVASLATLAKQRLS